MVDGEKLLFDIIVKNLMADNVRGVLGHHHADPPLEIYEISNFHKTFWVVSCIGGIRKA